MKKRVIKLAIHPVFIFLIFVFVARLCSYITQYRETLVSVNQLEISILSTIVIVVLLSIVYGFLICWFIQKKPTITKGKENLLSEQE